MGQLASKEPKPKGGGLTNLADDANIEALEDEIKRAQDAALGFTAQAELLAQVWAGCEVHGDLPPRSTRLTGPKRTDTQH